MAHFAEIGIDGKVIRVLVVGNEIITDSSGVEKEELGIKHLQDLFGGVWKQTSYNGKIRKNYAGIGFLYDNEKDVFIPPKPFDSWVLNESTFTWNPPVSMPEDGKQYKWDEQSLSWIEE